MALNVLSVLVEQEVRRFEMVPKQGVYNSWNFWNSGNTGNLLKFLLVLLENFYNLPCNFRISGTFCLIII